MSDDPNSNPPVRPPSGIESEPEPNAADALAFAAADSPTDIDPTRWSPPEPEALDPLFPDYEVQQLLGRGGMGAVYKAFQTKLKRFVAIKVLPPEMAEADPSFAQRFQREAEAMAALDHPNIVHVYDFGETEAGHSYFVMEFVDGMDFHQLIHTGQLESAGALNAVSQICDALEYAHEQGYVHRDIKPANIFINQKGILKVGDFGLAKITGEPSTTEGGTLLEPMLTQTGLAMGTPAYSAPEQMDGRVVDRRADIYSLGVMFYEMLTGELPQGAFQPPSQKVKVDVRLDHVVLKAMASEPERRYSNATEMRTEVDEVRTGPTVAPPAAASDGRGPWRSWWEWASDPVERARVQRRMLFAALLIICIAVGASWYSSKLSDEFRLPPEELEAPPATASETPKVPMEGDFPDQLSGQLVVIPFGENRDEIAIPQIPTGFDDVVHVSATAYEGKLFLHLVRSDGSAWKLLPGQRPDPKGAEIRKFLHYSAMGILLHRDGIFSLDRSPQTVPLRKDLDRLFNQGLKEVACANGRFVALDMAGRIRWMSEMNAFDALSESYIETPAGNGFKAVALGWDHGVAIDSSDRIVGWGNLPIPKQVSENSIKSIGATGSTTSAIDAYGRVFLWGGGFDPGQSASVKGKLAEIHDAEEIFTSSTPKIVAIRHQGRRWSVLEQERVGLDWIELSSVASKLEGCHSVSFTKGIAVGIREKDGEFRLPPEELEAPPATTGGTPKTQMEVDSSDQLSGQLVVIPFGENRDEIAIPHIPTGFDDVVHASAEALNGNLMLHLVRSDGSAWRLLPGQRPDPKGTEIRKYIHYSAMGILLHRDGSFRLDGSPQTMPLRKDLDRFFNQGLKEVEFQSGIFVALDKVGRIGWMSEIPSDARSESYLEVPVGNGFKAVALGWDHGVAIDSSDRIAGWGTLPIPKQVSENSIKSIGATGSTTAAIDIYGRVFLWGAGFNLGQSASMKAKLAEIHDAEEIFTTPSPKIVAIRHQGRRWSVLEQESIGLDWIELSSVASKLEGCHFVSFTDGVAVGIREGDGTIEAEVVEKTDPNSEAPFANSLGMEFVPVPIPNGPTAGQQLLFSKWETRVADYREFADATNHDWPAPNFEQGDDHPAVHVSWEDARAFCAWLTERERASGKIGPTDRYRLPSDHEWSCAVEIGHLEDPASSPNSKSPPQGPGQPDSAVQGFPMGDRIDIGFGNGASQETKAAGFLDNVVPDVKDGYAATAPVGSFKPNRFGLFDLSGNVWEWCEDTMDPDSNSSRVRRGACWASVATSSMRSARREGGPQDSRTPTNGFRCVLLLEANPTSE
jgi:serine/threonine protein kinase